MKALLIATAALASSQLLLAQEVGRVISKTPVVQQVPVPRQVCTIEQVTVQPPKSGAGAAMGAIAGGAMGNAVGGGTGKAAATMVGILGGAIVGDNIEGAPPAYNQNVQRCTTQTFYESRTVGYNIVYEYAGKQYSVQLPNDPGPTIALQITPVGSAPAAPPPTYAAPMQPPVVVPAPSNFVVVPAPYPSSYVPPFSYYPPVSLELSLGYWNSRYHRHGREHRH